jgi:hypothetical protein
MMVSTILFLIHGVGQRPASGVSEPAKEIARTWWKEPVAALLEAAKEFAPDVPIGLNVDEGVKIVPLSYCDFIVDELERWHGVGSGDVAGAVATNFPRLNTGYLDELRDISADDAGFFWAKSVDVLLYRVFHDRAIRQHVRAQIVAALKDNSGSNQLPAVAFMAHSLGTAVLHDTLFELLNDPVEFGGLVNLDILAYASLANVSKVLANLANPHESLVRPFGAPGAGRPRVRTFVDARHDWDPIPYIGGFKPAWETATSRYRPARMHRIHDINTHSYVGYVRHPAVWGPVLEKVLQRPLAPAALAHLIARHDALPEAPCIAVIKELADAVTDLKASMEALRPQSAWQAITALTKAARLLQETKNACV